MPHKRKKIKSKQTKSKTAKAKPSKKPQRNAKHGAKPSRAKKVIKKKHAKKKTAKSRASRIPGSRMNEVRKFASPEDRQNAVSGRQSGDLQGLSRAEEADSESVDELVEEGNLFEAGAVAGVERADDLEEREVQTQEMPEDDVPEEYLDKD